MATPSNHDREAEIHATLNIIHNNGTPVEYDANPLITLIVIADSVATLCWNIETVLHLPAPPHPTGIAAQDIIEEATKIAGICLAEIDEMHKGIKRAGITIVSDCAESSLRGGYPLDSLDIDIDPAERIKRLIEALGDAAPYWVHTGDANGTEIGYREETIAMLAYHATCAIIATNRQLIAN